jgi:hypothetical protein
MRLPRVRFTIRQMLILVAILALLLGPGRWAYDRYLGRTLVKTYYIGDLVGGTSRSPKGQTGFLAKVAVLSEQAALLKSSVTPDVWWVRTRSVTPSPLSMSLIIRHTDAGHRQVAEWLRQQRNLIEARNR